MNARKKGQHLGRSSLAKSKLFRSLGHVHNPFSMSQKDYNVEDYPQDKNVGSFRAMSLQVEMAKAEAFFTAYNLVARFQKS